MSGCCAHQSRERSRPFAAPAACRRSRGTPSMVAQYTMPATDGDTSPAVTPAIASSRKRVPRSRSPSAISDSPCPTPPEHRQVGVAEALRDRGDLLVRPECRLDDRVPFLLPEGDRDQEVAGLDGLAPQLLDQLGGSAEPRTGLGNLAAEREAHPGPPAGSGRAFELARRRADGEPAHPCLQGDIVPPDEVGRHAEQLEPVEIERRLTVGRHQELDGGRPRLRVVRGASAVEELVPRDLPLGRHRRAGTVRLRRPDQPSGSAPAGSDRGRSKCRRVGQDGRVCRT